MTVATTQRLEKLVEVDAHEGPVYVADDDALYFTTLPRDLRVDVKRLDLRTRDITTVRADANMANGMFLGLDGRLVVCEQGTFATRARIASLDPATGETEPIVDNYRGKPLNSPNDVVVESDGAIWFTDASYGHLQGFRPPPALRDAVYRYADRQLEVVASDFDKPNGIAFSPDERILYVSDNGAPHHLRAFENGFDRAIFVGTPEHPDGVKVARDGRIFVSATTGVQILAPTGELVGDIHLPGAVNLTFGGADSNVLYITADTAFWAAVVDAKGA